MSDSLRYGTIRGYRMVIILFYFTGGVRVEIQSVSKVLF